MGDVVVPALAVGSQVAGGLINSMLSRKATEFQTDQQKNLMDFQWKNYLSPVAQVNAYSAAGLNPAAMFGNGSAISSGPSPGSVTAPTFGIGTTSMTDLSQLLLGLAQAKQAGADTRNTEADTILKAIQKDRDELELKYRDMFGSKSLALDVANAYQSLRLAQQQEDTNKIEQEEKRWKVVTQKVLGELSGNQRDIAAKELANKDKELGLRNQLLEEQAKTERSSQSANYASAEHSRASAEKEREEAKYQNMVNNLKDATMSSELKAMLSEYASKSAENKAKVQEFIHMFDRFKKLNENNKNAGADYMDHLFWYIKEQMPSLPIVPFLKLGN